jgi:hypothetical protein
MKFLIKVAPGEDLKDCVQKERKVEDLKVENLKDLKDLKDFRK